MIKKKLIYIIFPIIFLLVLFFKIINYKENFQTQNAGKTIVLDEGGVKCPPGKTKELLNEFICPSGFKAAYLSMMESVRFKCVIETQMCPDSHNYDHIQNKCNRYYPTIQNGLPIIGGRVCRQPSRQELRIIDGPFCQISRLENPKCKDGYTFDRTINKCFRCV